MTYSKIINMKKFKILLVNDDGYKAEGINILYDVLAEDGHDVWILAPESQRSACSHAISLNRKLKIVKVSEKHYFCDGYPADCVLFADKGAIPEMGKADMVISGINCGFNISTDLVYSATAGGASEGAVRGYPSIAVSCNNTNGVSYPYDDSAQFVKKYLSDFYSLCLPNSYININVPENSNLKWGVATVGNIEYYDNLVRHERDEENGEEFSIRGEAAPQLVSSNFESSDFDLVNTKSMIAVSMIKVLPAINNNGNYNLSELAGRDIKKI